MDEEVLGEVELLRGEGWLVKDLGLGREARGEGEIGGIHAFLIWLFHFWAPTRTFTVFCMRPAETTTAFICREAEVASFWVDILRCMRLLTQLRAEWVRCASLEMREVLEIFGDGARVDPLRCAREQVEVHDLNSNMASFPNSFTIIRT